MDVYRLVQWSAYALVCLLYFAAAELVRRSGARARRTSGRWKRLRSVQARRWLVSPQADAAFERSGYPFGLNAYSYQLIRYFAVTGWLGVGAADMAISGASSLPGALLQISGPLLLWLMTNTRASIATYLLGKWKDVHDGEKNRELFMVYSMIADEIKEQGPAGRKLSLLAMLTKLRDYTTLIRPSLNIGLRRFDEGPHAAMQAVAAHIGTKEAIELCSLLADLDLTTNGDLSALVEAREESYMTLLRENRRRRRKFIGHLAYGVAFTPLLVYLWNALQIAQQYVTDLAKNTNQLG